MAERWLPLVGAEGLYEVSDMGNVRSVERIDRLGRTRAPKALKPGSLKYGHLYVTPSVNGKQTSIFIHKAVLLAFVGPPPEGMICRHLNGDASDNRLENLKWGTQKENVADTKLHGKMWQTNRTQCPRGHLLEQPNLVAANWRKGGRTCLACSRARAFIQKNPGRELQSVSDQYYQAIMD